MKESRPTAIIGKAALHLACFHLARMGHDFTITRENSKTGDVWADFGSGIEVVEVKGTTAGAWQLRAEQMALAQRYIFVAVDDGACWLVPTSAVVEHMRGKDRGSLTIKQIRALPSVELHKMVGRVAPGPAKGRSLPYKENQRGRRTVRHTLADGTVKVYRYGPYERRIYNQPTTGESTP